MHGCSRRHKCTAATVQFTALEVLLSTATLELGQRVEGYKGDRKSRISSAAKRNSVDPVSVTLQADTRSVWQATLDNSSCES